MTKTIGIGAGAFEAKRRGDEVRRGALAAAGDGGVAVGDARVGIDQHTEVRSRTASGPPSC